MALICALVFCVTFSEQENSKQSQAFEAEVLEKASLDNDSSCYQHISEVYGENLSLSILDQEFEGTGTSDDPYAQFLKR